MQPTEGAIIPERPAKGEVKRPRPKTERLRYYPLYVKTTRRFAKDTRNVNEEAYAAEHCKQSHPADLALDRQHSGRNKLEAREHPEEPENLVITSLDTAGKEVMNRSKKAPRAQFSPANGKEGPIHTAPHEDERQQPETLTGSIGPRELPPVEDEIPIAYDEGRNRERGECVYHGVDGSRLLPDEMDDDYPHGGKDLGEIQAHVAPSFQGLLLSWALFTHPFPLSCITTYRGSQTIVASLTSPYLGSLLSRNLPKHHSCHFWLPLNFDMSRPFLNSGLMGPSQSLKYSSTGRGIGVLFGTGISG